MKPHPSFALSTATCLLAIIALAGCSGWLGQDFNRATRVAEFDIGNIDQVKRTVTLSEGVVALIIAVPNYKCSPLDSAVDLKIAMRSAKSVLLEQSVKLSDLTWSYGGDSCNAYGYPKLELDERTSLPSATGLRVNITNDHKLVEFEARISAPTSAKNRRVFVWAIYGDRVPGDRVFKE
jgi:hypothetical protein